jgi:hypothetical protein
MKSHLYNINPEQAVVLAHKLRWKIMKLLFQSDQIYAKQVAKKLNVSESKIHYHLDHLRHAGLIESEGILPIKQGRAKLLKPVASGFILSLSNETDLFEESTYTKILLPNFFSSGTFDAKIIVGSSVPHGRYDAISRDGHLVGDLCWYLGSKAASKSNHNIPNHVVTDLDFLKENSRSQSNLILIGGHITNEMTARYNEVLKEKFNVYFRENKIIYGSKEYKEPSDGLISLFRNPKNSNKWILILAGVRSLGTRATIYSIVNDCIELFSDKDEFVTIIKGDLNGNKRVSGVTGLLIKGINEET